MTMHDNLYGEEQMYMRAGATVELAALALAFGRIDRTGPCHPDGTPESDSDHTVMLGWVAPCLADLINHRMGFPHYNLNEIAAYALVHDAAEVYAGDTCTIRITEEELQDKEVREATATAKLHHQFAGRLPWFANKVANYEDQVTKEARFVRAVDKLLPKMVHLVDKRIGLKQQGVTRAEFLTLINRQRQQVIDNVSAGNVFVVGLYDILCNMVLSDWPVDEPTPAVPPQPAERHWLNASAEGVYLHHAHCSHDFIATCPFTLAFDQAQKNSSIHLGLIGHGDWPVRLDDHGILHFIEEN